jgi:hypothetical protein
LPLPPAPIKATVQMQYSRLHVSKEDTRPNPPQ